MHAMKASARTLPSVTVASLRQCEKARRFSSGRIIQDQVNQRYGTANQPPTHLNKPDQARETPAIAQPEDGGKLQAPVQDTRDATPSKDAAAANAPSSSTETRPAPSESNAADSTSALSSILSMQPPMSESASESHPPHLQTPPYVHHFDTYSFIKALQSEQGFSEAQSVTIMKAIRALLSDNMDLAREGIVSRGDAEMDAYQFRAASGELRTEMRQRRAAADERYRADRIQLQHEVDLLAQRVSQESLNLKDELKGMFDDRKMAVRMERRATDNRIQELGYKITTELNSGMRNEIEGLRFVLTRRTVLALTAVVIMSLMALRLATYSSKKEDQRKGVPRPDEDEQGDGGGGDVPGELSSEEIARSVQRGSSPALASMGGG